MIKHDLSDPTDPLFRYANDEWYFSMLLTNGKVLGFKCIKEIYKGFVTIEMLDINHQEFYAFGEPVRGSPTSRNQVIVKESEIVAICEIADT